MNELAIGDTVIVSCLAVQRKIYGRGIRKRFAVIKAFGKGPNTRLCAHIEFTNGTEDFVHVGLLEKVSQADVAKARERMRLTPAQLIAERESVLHRESNGKWRRPSNPHRPTE